MPKLLSSEHRDAFVMRLAEYVRDTGLSRCSVVFHGGEPLLAGAELLEHYPLTHGRILQRRSSSGTRPG